jgi:molecular chaperone Hsp33
MTENKMTENRMTEERTAEEIHSFYKADGAPENPEADYIVRATAYNGQVRALAIRSTALCSEALRIHQTSPVATAALGRFLSGSLLLADSLKSEDDTQTTIIRCDGPIHGMTAVCDSKGNVRGYCNEPVVENTFHYPGKLDVGSAIGQGILTVIRDFGLKEPYVGAVELISGEIAEDFTRYLAESEQTPSIMSLGVLLDGNGVAHAGGFLIQLLPGAEEDIIEIMEKRAGGGFPDVTFLMKEGMNPEKILDMFLGDPGINYLSATKVSYTCNCSRDRMERNLITLGKVQLDELSEDENGISLECHFCDKVYSFDREALHRLSSLSIAAE